MPASRRAVTPPSVVSAGVPDVLILSASIGAGHDLPAQLLAGALAERGRLAEVADGLAALGPVVERAIMTGTVFDSDLRNRLFDVQHFLGLEFGPTRRLGGRLIGAAGGASLLRHIGARHPAVVVSTYPGVTEQLGRLRRAGRLRVPVAAVITDLASLHMWAHPGIDLHLVTHPESIAEVRGIAGPGADVVAVRGLNPRGFDAPPTRAAARAAIGLPAAAQVVLVSGGGWGVGDVEGAVAVALEASTGAVLVLCGTNAGLQARVAALGSRVRAFGFTDRMPELMAAADVLVHSTAGLTVLEALICGCRVISYGWGRGHIRINNAAFRRFGLADVAAGPAQLRAMLTNALAAPAEPDRSWFALSAAADVLLGRFPALQQAG